MPEDIPEPADRRLTNDENAAIACEWSDYRRDYLGGVTPEQLRAAHRHFEAGWAYRHLHGYTPEPSDTARRHEDARAARVADTMTLLSHQPSEPSSAAIERGDMAVDHDVMYDTLEPIVQDHTDGSGA